MWIICVLEALYVCLFFKKKHKKTTPGPKQKTTQPFFLVPKISRFRQPTSVPREVRSSVERYDPSTGHWEATMGKDGKR